MNAYNIEMSGIVTGHYSNGLIRVLGQIALASFSNPEGLMKLGGNLYDATSNSGEARVGTPGTMDRGLIQSGALEMSNVDLAFEFTEMITTSRGYQANARMISTSDEMLIELINIKR
jgi:flagellar hook protein FlgE